MKEIPLTQGQFAIVDDEDYERFSVYKWRVFFAKGTKSYYARRHSPMSLGKRSTIFMHRDVMGAKHGEMVDHINHDTLDNRKSNL